MAVSTIKNKALVKERFTVASDLTINANSILGTTQSATATKSGYRPIGLVGWGASNNSVNVMYANMNASGTVYMRVSNLSSSQLTGVSLTADVLFEPI